MVGSGRRTVDLAAVGYVRRSTDRQEQSIPDQKRAIEGYAAEHGLRLSKHYVDDAIRGTSTVGRRAFQQMVTDAQAPSKPFGYVIVYDVKRFGRIDNDEAGYYRHVLRTHGVEVRYVSENFSGDATDDLLRPVKQWQARQESKDLSRVTIRGLLSKMAPESGGGWWMGGVPPHGYDLRYESIDGQFLFIVRYMPNGTKRLSDEQGTEVRTLARGESISISKRDRARLVPSAPERVMVIQNIFRMYVEQGKGFKSIAETLNLEEVPTPRGPAWSRIYSGAWTDTTIRAVLVNPTYAGDLVWNRRTDGRFYSIRDGQAVERESVHGARLVPNDESDWLIVRDAHSALVSRRMFEQARERRESHISSIEQRGRDPRLRTQGANHGRTWNGARSRFTLSGIIKCGRCGNRYQGVTKRKGKARADGTKIVARQYDCGGYITKGKRICTSGPVPQERLESAVIEAVLGYYTPLMGGGGRSLIEARVKEHLGMEREDVAEARGRAEDERTRVSGIIDRLLDNITPANREEVDRRLAELTKQRQVLESRLTDYERLDSAQSEVKALVDEVIAFLGSLEQTLREGVPQEKLVALRQCAERVTVEACGHARVELRTLPLANAATATMEIHI